MQEFALENKEYIELCNLLKVMALCDSGGMAKVVISEGQVLVDGEVETRKRYKVRRGQMINFQGEQVLVK